VDRTPTAHALVLPASWTVIDCEIALRLGAAWPVAHPLTANGWILFQEAMLALLDIL